VSEPAEQGKTPDGTSVIRFDTAETKLGATPHAARYRKARESAYTQLFGEALNVSLLDLFPTTQASTRIRPKPPKLLVDLA
jgi:hypothetical protein